MSWIGRTAAAALVAAGACAAARAGDAAAVQSDFDRCAAQMERATRSLREYERTLGQLNAELAWADSAAREQVRADRAALEGRAEYFRNRLDRAAGQADKIRDDLGSVTGPTCPSCVVSAVSMYCRNAEAIQTEIESYADRAAALQTRIRHAQGGRRTAVPESSYRTRRQSLDSLAARFAPALDSCTDKAGAVFTRQARLNMARTDSLHRAGRATEAEAALGVSETLLRKALDACRAR